MSASLVEQAVQRYGVDAFLAALSPALRARLPFEWRAWARPEQLPPPGDYRTWFVKAGRGFGKSRTGAEWAREKARVMPGSHGALVAPTAADVRDVMVRALLTPWNGGQLEEVPLYEPSKRLVTWKNGTTATTYSADEPERLRGPQHHWAWADEVGSWRYVDAWDQLQFGLRLGTRAQACVTGTPRTTELVKRILKLPSTVVTHGSTFDNAANLDPHSLEEMKARYAGTRLGRQELEGILLEDIEGALWTHSMIEKARRDKAPELSRVVVAVDPSGSAKRTADEAGIVVVGTGPCGCLGRQELHAFVLEDLSGRYNPSDMGGKAVGAYHRWKASRLVAEDNFGGKIIEDLVRLIDSTVAYRAVHASRGKIIRAEPVSALYEQGKVHHVGLHRELEDEMCSFAPLVSTESPGRLDAMVWGVTDLMLGEGTASFGFDSFSGGRRTF